HDSAKNSHAPSQYPAYVQKVAVHEALGSLHLASVVGRPCRSLLFFFLFHYFGLRISWLIVLNCFHLIYIYTSPVPPARFSNFVSCTICQANDSSFFVWRQTTKIFWKL